ncbi:DUF6152 family protein [uncultured Paracoccus sp.]|uniref:DUF6152 family protein n=1 Tax=uncultured Paracoccus sp. TaxID=189685 RepID=UPI002621282E|nr:DUF6152 family protein [uncultured Paracoccus sp.]
MLSRRTLASALLLSLLGVRAVTAHHGWRWTSGADIRLTGLIRSARLGNPHGILEVDAEGEIWQVEIGQPWRNEQAGLTDADFAPGREVAIEGEPSADPAQRLLKAERLWFEDGVSHDLYPERS